MKNEKLDEIIDMARKAIRITEDKILDTEVVELDKKSFISVGGAFDNILILALELKKEDEDEHR